MILEIIISIRRCVVKCRLNKLYTNVQNYFGVLCSGADRVAINKYYPASACAVRTWPFQICSFGFVAHKQQKICNNSFHCLCKNILVAKAQSLLRTPILAFIAVGYAA